MTFAVVVFLVSAYYFGSKVGGVLNLSLSSLTVAGYFILQFSTPAISVQIAVVTKITVVLCECKHV